MKNRIRVVVLLGLLAWPGLEIYRIQSAKQQLAESQALNQTLSQKLATLEKLEGLKTTDAAAPPAIPVRTVNPEPISDSQ